MLHVETTLMAESEEALNSQRADLKLNIQNTKIMATHPITSRQIDGEIMETVKDYFWGLQNH